LIDRAGINTQIEPWGLSAGLQGALEKTREINNIDL